MNIVDVAKASGSMALAPIRIRRNPPTPPTGSEHYEPTALAAAPESATLKARDVPVAKTPSGGWDEWPSPVLVGCDEPLTPGAPDLRGVWQVYKGRTVSAASTLERSATDSGSGSDLGGRLKTDQTGDPSTRISARSEKNAT